MSSIAWDNLSARIGYRSRAKGIPTGAFDTKFDDPNTSTVDETLWGQIGMQRELAPTLRVTVRGYADRYRYRGVYSADSGHRILTAAAVPKLEQKDCSCGNHRRGIGSRQDQRCGAFSPLHTMSSFPTALARAKPTVQRRLRLRRR